MANGNKDTETCRSSTCGNSTRKKYSNLEIPQMTGHTGEHLLRTTAENMGIKLTGKLEPCKFVYKRR